MGQESELSERDGVMENSNRSVGVMEYWVEDPSLQHSSTPSFQFLAKELQHGFRR
jgi:hypothetical protein